MRPINTTARITLGVTAIVLAVGGSAFAQSGPDGPGGWDRERPSFNELDSDGDGKLTVVEMQAQAAARFEAMDSNGDGILSAQEMAAGASAKAGERAVAMFARLLEWRDSDGDGALSAEELGNTRAEQMFSRVDADKDGVISAEEYAQAKTKGRRFGRAHKGGHAKHQDG